MDIKPHCEIIQNILKLPPTLDHENYALIKTAFKRKVLYPFFSLRSSIDKKYLISFISGLFSLARLGLLEVCVEGVRGEVAPAAPQPHPLLLVGAQGHPQGAGAQPQKEPQGAGQRDPQP